MTVNLSGQLPHVVIEDDKQVHVVPVFSIRQIANGQNIDTELSQIIAKAYLNELGLR
tara:strand:+ start:94 stop:264 length:171 start_codon:yes stop_codon:yes gene_type:complete